MSEGHVTVSSTGHTIPKLKTKKITARVDSWLKIQEQLDELYKQRDEIEAEILTLLPPGIEVPVTAAFSVKVTDAFANTNLVFGHGPVRRFKIEVVDLAKKAKKAAAADRKAAKERGEK